MQSRGDAGAAQSQATKALPSASSPARKPLAIRHEASALLPDAAVAGWIVDSTGEPIVDAAIYRVDGHGEAAERVALTEGDGAYRFATPPTEGETLMLMGASVFPSTFRHVTHEMGVRIMATRRMRLAARVMHEGNPVVGAEVALRDGSGPSARVELSDSEGHVYFEDLVPGVYELWAHGHALASPVVRASRLSSSTEVVDLAMREASSGVGRVLAGDGSGLVASVTLVPEDLHQATRQLQSDETGQFSIDGLMPGRWQVKVQAAGYVSTSEHVLQAGLERVEMELRLERGGTATGRVVDSNGNPVANARLVLRGKRSTRAAPTPAQNLGLPMRWVHPLATRRYMPIRDSRRFGAARDGLRPAECGHGHCGVDIGTERGRVVHAAGDARVARVIREGQGKAGRYIVLEHQSGLKSFYMHLDEIRDDLVAGQRVRAGQPIGTIGRTGVIRSGAHLHFALSQVQGERTWFIDPEPILQHAVVLPFPGDLNASRLESGGFQPMQIATVMPDSASLVSKDKATPERDLVLRSDGEGRFHLEGLAAGRYTASAFHNEFAPGTRTSFVVQHGVATNDVVVRLQPGVEIYGLVQGREGAIAGAKIVAEEGSELDKRVVASTFADAEGRFRLRRLGGRVTLRVSAPGYGIVERDLKLASTRATPTSRQETFELASQDQKLVGQVRDPAGFPMREASVRIVSGPSGRGRRANTDEYGHFLIANLSQGTYRVDVLSAAYPTASQKINTEGAHELRLEQGGGVRLRLRDAHNREALAGVRAMAFGPKGSRTSVVTDRDGEALLPALRVGSWSLRVQAQGYVRQEREIMVRAGAGSEAPAVEQVMELSRGASLAGILRDANGDRVAGARVWVGGSSTTTDQDGRFQLSDVSTGEVVLSADRDEELGELELNLAAGDELVTLDLRLE